MDSMIRDIARRHFEESIAVKQAFLKDPVQLSNLVAVAKLCIECYRRGNKMLIAGNGGSAADAQHFAGELVSRFNFDRPPLSAIALTTDTSVLTAIGNDYGYEQVFTRQIKANAANGDLYIAITTSGKSPNILNSLRAAKGLNVQTIGLTGKSGTELDELCNTVIRVPSNRTPVIQELHISIIHFICDAVEKFIFDVC